MLDPAREQLHADLIAAKTGDQSAFEALLARYTPLLESLVQTFAQHTPDCRDDLRQEACIAFYYATLRFDEAQNVPFGLYAKTCMRNRLISYMRRIPSGERLVSLDDTQGMTESASDPVQRIVEEEGYRSLYQTIEKTLSQSESRIWWLYLSGRTAREIGLMLGRDEKSVQNAVYRIRKKLRTTLQDP